MREADPAYGYILIGLSDIVGKAIYTGYSYWFDEVTRWTDTLDALAYLIDYPQRVMEGGFSPLYAEAFLRWRTNYQWLNHGVSNWSSIPNWEYNQRMETMLARAKERLQGNDAVEARSRDLGAPHRGDQHQPWPLWKFCAGGPVQVVQ